MGHSAPGVTMEGFNSMPSNRTCATVRRLRQHREQTVALKARNVQQPRGSTCSGPREGGFHIEPEPPTQGGCSRLQANTGAKLAQLVSIGARWLFHGGKGSSDCTVTMPTLLSARYLNVSAQMACATSKVLSMSWSPSNRTSGSTIGTKPLACAMAAYRASP